MTELHANYYPEYKMLTVWNDDSSIREFRVYLPSGELSLLAETLGDAGYLVTSNWVSKSVTRKTFPYMTATIERVEEWDSRNGVVSRHAPDSAS